MGNNVRNPLDIDLNAVRAAARGRDGVAVDVARQQLEHADVGARAEPQASVDDVNRRRGCYIILQHHYLL